MANDIAKRGEVDISLGESDMMMIMMMVMMMVMMSQFLSPVLQQTQAQTQMLQAQAYGGTEDPRTVRVTNLLSWINLVYDYPFTPWVSAFIINDGPGPVEIGINYPDDRFTMYPGETRTVTRTGAVERIGAIYFIARPGLATTVRVTGVY